MLKIKKGSFEVSLLCHSVNPVGEEAITWAWTYPRQVHSEILTHRWSRNASSSRAIPYEKMLKWTQADPVLPLVVGSNQKGMVSGPEVDKPDQVKELIKWLFNQSVSVCGDLVYNYNVHKEIANRYLEPWGYINVVATMGKSQLMNAFCLRCTPEANQFAQQLFVNAARLYRQSKPKQLNENEWHLPYITQKELDEASMIHTAKGGNESALDYLLTWSVARSAWTSYKTVEGTEATWERAKRRHDDCIRLKHVTPCEHQLRARADHEKTGVVPGYDSYRMMIPGESTSQFDFSILDTLYKDKDYILPCVVQ